MKTALCSWRSWSLSLPLAIAWGCSGHAAVLPADLVLTSGNVYTVDPERSWAEALAVRDGVIVALGNDADIAHWVGAGTRKIDLDGAMVLPGFHDSHVHPLWGGRMLRGCSLDQLYSLQPLLAKIRQCAAESQEGWIVGHNWDLSVFPMGNPNKSLLDEIAPDMPVFLTGSDRHSAWVNSKALELAGITAATPQPPYGFIEKDVVSGEPTGTLRETAIQLVYRLLPRPSDSDNAKALKTALMALNRAGVTSLVDAYVDEPELRGYRLLESTGELTARVVTSLVFGPNMFGYGAQFASMAKRLDEFASERINPKAVKLFLDFVLESETAALLEPYRGNGEHKGQLNLAPAELAAAVTRFDAMGLQVHMHAIGDRAVRAGLDAVAAAARTNGKKDNRHHIAHLQLVHPDDIPRFKALDVAANFEAYWAYPDTWILQMNLPLVGRERVERMYPIGSIQRAGARIVASSDWPISSLNPLLAMETAIRRVDPLGDMEGVLNENEQVDLATMIDAYTINGAWLMHQEHEVGSLEVGKRADLVVLGKNLFEIPPEEISEVPILLTVVDGDIVYEANAELAAKVPISLQQPAQSTDRDSDG